MQISTSDALAFLIQSYLERDENAAIDVSRKEKKELKVVCDLIDEIENWAEPEDVEIEIIQNSSEELPQGIEFKIRGGDYTGFRDRVDEIISKIKSTEIYKDHLWVNEVGISENFEVENVSSLVIRVKNLFEIKYLN